MLVNYCILAKVLGLAQATKQTREGVSVELGLSALEQRKKIIEAASFITLAIELFSTSWTLSCIPYHSRDSNYYKRLGNNSSAVQHTRK